MSDDDLVQQLRVKDQYDRYPFPDYSASGEKPKPVLANCDGLSRISARLFEGRLDPSMLNVLVAGGGTGEKTLALALQLAPYGGRVTHLDLSSSAIATARRACADYGLEDTVRFVEGSILDVATLFPEERFDYIQCMGVLHHMPNPEAGLAALCSVLSEDGGLALAVYGKIGRTGVYLLRNAFEVLLRDVDSNDEKIDIAHQVLEKLPATNWMNFDQSTMTHLQLRGRRAILDAVLHAVDHCYTIRTFWELIHSAELNFVGFSEPYGTMVLEFPHMYGFDPDVLERLRAMPRLERWEFLELIHGQLRVHSAYLSRKPQKVPTLSTHLDFIPQVTRFSTIKVTVEDRRKLLVVDRRFGGINFDVGETAGMFVKHIDAKLSVREILEKARGQLGDNAPSVEELARQIDREAQVLFELDLICLCDRSLREGEHNLVLKR